MEIIEKIAHGPEGPDPVAGSSLPHRSPGLGSIVATVRAVAMRAGAGVLLILWVTENNLDHVTSFDPVVGADLCCAAVTSRIGLGAVRSGAAGA